jgi:DNA-binding CsgD family transcriptional regulator
MLNQDFEKNAQQQIKGFLGQFKSIDRIHIPQNRISDLVDVLSDSANISANFNKENPFSVMETVTIALCVLNSSDNEIGGILGISPNTVRSYMGRIKEKLNVSRKIEAVTKSLREGIIKIIY